MYNFAMAVRNVNLLRYIVRTLIIFLILAFISFVLIYPKMSAASALMRTKSEVMLLKNATVNNRGGWTQLYALDPSDPEFNDEKSTIIAALEESSSKDAEAIKKKVKVPNPTFPSGAKKTLDDTRKQLPDLQTKGSDYFEKQKLVLEAVKQIDAVLKNVLEYDPRQDFSLITGQEYEKEIVLEGISLTRNGLNKSSVALAEKKLNINESGEFTNSRSEFDGQLAVFAAAVERGDWVTVNNEYQKLDKSYTRVKMKAFQLYRAMIESDKGKEMLAEGGLVVDELDLLINDIRKAQEIIK